MPQPFKFNDRLSGKVALVTGAGSIGKGYGTGKAIAFNFAAEGAKVCLVDRDAGAAEETRSIIDAAGGDAIVCLGDITIEPDCARVVAATVERYGKLDILVNNVGISIGGGRLESLDMSVWDRVLDINLRGAVLLTKHAAPHLIGAGNSAIVNIASIAGLLASGGAAYGPSKAALISLTRELALLYGRSGVRANVICPGHIQTPHVEGLIDEKMRDWRRRIGPLGVEGDAWDVAAAAVFLASDESRFITAVCLPVDGGATGVLPMSGHGLIQGWYDGTEP
jgi:NAD(P)-dependent dehydrogenase (short-subunit alcohol dehydrogenase family)